MWFFLLVFGLLASLIGFKKKTFLLVFSNVLVCISKVCRPFEFLICWSATLLFFSYKPNCCQALCCYWEYTNVPKMEKNLRWHPSQTPRVLRLSFEDAEESYQNKALTVGIIQGELLWQQLPYWALIWDHMACLRPARAEWHEPGLSETCIKLFTNKFKRKCKQIQKMEGENHNQNQTKQWPKPT